MNKDFISGIETLANEKNIAAGSVFAALEDALQSAVQRRYSKRFGDDFVVINLDHETGEFKVYQIKVAAEHRYTEDGEPLSLNDIPEEYHQQTLVEEIELGRIAVQTAKQVIVQKVREASRQQLADEYTARIGEIFSGQVKKVTRDYLVIDINPADNLEGILQRDQMLARDMYRVGDSVRAVLFEVGSQPRGYLLRLSRTHPLMLNALFRQEIVEIEEQVVEVRAVAREAGIRAKVAVKTNDRRIDPIGACIGLRGSRIQRVIDAVHGEKIDVVEWSDDPAQLVINILAPITVLSVVIDEDVHTIDVAVSQENQAQAIGRNGLNVRLTSELLGWKINVMTETDANKKYEQEASTHVKLFVDKLDIDEGMAQVLVAEGFNNVAEVAYVDISELEHIDGFDRELADALQNRAKEYLLDHEEDQQSIVQPAQELLDLELMTNELAAKLVAKGIVTRDDLAELATDELTDIVAIDKDQAATLIMDARAFWFAEEDKA